MQARKAQIHVAFVYQNLLGDLGELFLQGPEHAEQARCAFEQEWPQIRHQWKWCAAHAAEDNAAAKLCSLFAGIAGHLLEHQLSRIELVTWREAGLAV